MSAEDYAELLDTMEACIKHLRPLRENQRGLNVALGLLKECRLNARYNPGFREESTPYLENILNEMYVELEGE